MSRKSGITLLMFSVYDAATEAFMQPFFARSKGEAVRSFTAAANAEDHQFYKHADDYTLFQIGVFDDGLGEVTPVTPTSLGTALEYRSAPVRRSPQIELEDAIREASNGR